MLRIFTVVLTVTTIWSCSETKPEPTPKGRIVFEDHFDSIALPDHWLDTSGGKYSIVDGELRAHGARNKPLWLKTKLPRNARIELAARSLSPAVDIKIEAFGDGVTFAKQASYKATSYVFILGGWNNSRSIIARMDEHGSDRKVREKPAGVKGKKYSFEIVRKGNLLSWLIDDEPFLEIDDPEPLEGPGHDHFAINNWETDVRFDDLIIYEL